METHHTWFLRFIQAKALKWELQSGKQCDTAAPFLPADTKAAEHCRPLDKVFVISEIVQCIPFAGKLPSKIYLNDILEHLFADCL